MEDALDKVVMGKILPIIAPSFLFAKRYTAGLNRTPGDALESQLYALEKGRGVSAGPARHPAPPPPTTGPDVQDQLDTILA